MCGSAGSGKTVLGVDFVVRGARQFAEPGVIMSFEETPQEISENVTSLGFDLKKLVARRLLVLDSVLIERSELREIGDYSLEGLFVRLGHAIDSIGAKRVLLDSVETLFAGLSDTAVLRGELRRLFRWLKTKGVTAVITAERGEGALTRHGFEEYISDCVILLDHRISNQMAIRRLRVVKYRGSHHGSDEYPFLMLEEGLSVLPVTSLGLGHQSSTERISTGVPRLDLMLGGKGYYRGSSVLVSGTAGTGKTSLMAQLLEATCKRGERCLAFLFEESPSQLIRNMRSIGIDLAPWVEKGQLLLNAARPTLHGLEGHLVRMNRLTEDFKPSLVALDPVSNLISSGDPSETRSMLTRLIDQYKTKQITTVFNSLTQGGLDMETTEVGISSLMDTWLLVRDLETNGERNRVLYVLKSRGMAHSNPVREFRLTDRRIDLLDVYVGQGGVLTGTARLAQEARESSALAEALDESQRLERELTRKRLSTQAQIDVLRLDLESTEAEQRRLSAQAQARSRAIAHDRAAMAHARHADPTAAPAPSKPRKSRGAS